MKAKKRTALLGRVYLIICLIVALFPIYWMINTSFKSDSEIYAKVPTLIPHHPTGAAYSYLINNTNFLSSMKNSLIIAVSVSVFSILIAYPVAYTLSRLKFKGRRIFSKSVLFMYLLPTTVLYIPLYMLVSKMHLTNTIWGLIVIYPTFTLPYVAWILIPHIAAVPKELEEAAFIDGSSVFNSFIRIMIPLSAPGIFTAAILSFIYAWNNFLFALILSSSSTKTLPMAVFNFISYTSVNWGGLMAAAVVITGPVIIVSIALQKYVVSGLTAGAVKG